MGKRKQELEKLVAWLDRVSHTALLYESRISPCGSARELPPEAPTQSEAHAFRDGLVIGMQISSTMAEDIAKGGTAPDREPLESYVEAINIWVKQRFDLAAQAGGGDAE